MKQSVPIQHNSTTVVFTSTPLYLQTRNGEYILSAMTSGIRSNWMKAIRLCMDLQNSNKNKESKPSELPSSSSSVRTNDDMDIDSSSSSSSKTSDKGRGVEKKDFIRKNRRHYSDVNPGNISKMFSVQGLTLDKSLSQSTAGQSSAASSVASSKDSEIRPELSLPSHMDLATTQKGKYNQFPWSKDSGSSIPFRRFVEGSDSHVTVAGAAADQSSNPSSDKDEEERKRRAKSPSAKIKERSRAKSPKLHSPPPGHEENKFTYRTEREEDKMSVSSEDISYMDDGEVCTLMLHIHIFFVFLFSLYFLVLPECVSMGLNILFEALGVLQMACYFVTYSI